MQKAMGICDWLLVVVLVGPSVDVDSGLMKETTEQMREGDSYTSTSAFRLLLIVTAKPLLYTQTAHHHLTTRTSAGRLSISFQV